MGLNAAQVQGVLALSREVVEKVVWEVVPVLAETMIKEELRRLTAESSLDERAPTLASLRPETGLAPGFARGTIFPGGLVRR